ncbi:hypothetical protein R6258_10890 [Halomonas sp. HP20-15]|uniref:hypothetical protein n=1 Tax=Halomonas sp. HP20-15 TaxID=3085901 RepID=UPI002982330E|nr:hypothetical protein [Halomonas sp. HP20-15]MDW5377422.1 hypothetical protein [Halomonas sp. HP20-15]
MPDSKRHRHCPPIAPWQGLLIVVWMSLAPFATAAGLAKPVAFEARYRLTLDGWPDMTIDHRLSRQGEHWQSRMQAEISIASARETSRFRMVDDGVEALLYTSRYRLMGFGEQFRLDADQLARLPDRQTALFSLARRAPAAECRGKAATPCTIRYRDHQGEEKTLDYRVLELDRHATPAGRFPAVTLEAWSPDKPERRLTLIFHRDVPGLLLGMSYRRDGERRSHLSLARVSIADDQPR